MKLEVSFDFEYPTAETMGTSIGVRPTEWKHDLESSDGRKNLIAVIIPVGGEDCKYSLSGIQFFRVFGFLH